MTAWRRPGKQQRLSLNGQQEQRPLFETGYDDDGENYGGKTLEKVLREASVEGAVMVARWYGGVMLGPVRFEHIRNCAREAVEKGKQEDQRLKALETECRIAKKAKEEDGGERQRLVSVLEERDLSIGVLRGLLADKKRELERDLSQKDEVGRSSSPSKEDQASKYLKQDSSQQVGAAAVSSPSKGADYAKMQLSAVIRLEQVRDKTIGWILAQIEEVEKAQLKEFVEAMEMEEQGGSEESEDLQHRGKP